MQPLSIQFVLIVTLAGFGFGSSIAPAQETLIVETADGTTIKRSGRVVSWIGDTIVIDSGKRKRRVAGDKLVELQTDWPVEMIEARKLASQGRHREAVRSLLSARESDNRDWVQAIITAELIESLNGSADPNAAVREFVRLYQADPKTRFFHLIPLKWITSIDAAPPIEESSRWLDSNAAVLRLMGASWQLTESRATDAVAMLQELSTHEDRRIALMATAQLWRKDQLTADATDVERWQRLLERFPSPLRPGPVALVADAQSRLGLVDDAMISLMKIPILYPEQRSLAAWALFKTGSILKQQSNGERAAAIWNELQQQHPESHFAELMNR